MALKLTIFDIIKGPVLTDKAYKQYKNLNKLALDVHPQANKPQIAEALEKLFNVKVKNICIVVRKGKIKQLRASRTTTQGPLRKRALVTLAEGYTLDLLNQGTVAHEGAAPEVEASATKE
jgi:large subunit ribosomal protein L23